VEKVEAMIGQSTICGYQSHRWVAMAALLLAMGTTMSARADDVGDCRSAETLLKTNPDRAVSACRRLADQGIAVAQRYLAIMYYNGRGVPQDYTQAAQWFSKAADQGDAVAQSNLGNMHYFGDGIPQNYAEAAKWYRKAADQGYAIAQFNLGKMILDGQGIRPTAPPSPARHPGRVVVP
jgi:uncharacterized protein